MGGNITAESLVLSNGLNVNNNFIMGSDGKLTVKEANVSGEINATSGTIGGMKISSDGISSGEVDDGNGMFNISKKGISLSYGNTSITLSIGTFEDLINGGKGTDAALLINDSTSTGIAPKITLTNNMAYFNVPVFLDIPKDYREVPIGALYIYNGDELRIRVPE